MLHDALFKGDDLELGRRAHLYIDLMVGCLLLVGAILVVTTLGGPVHPHSVPLLMGVLALVSSSLVVLRFSRSVEAATFVSLVPSLFLLTYMARLSGYLGAPAVFVLVVLPVMVLVTAGGRAGGATLGAVLAVLLMLGRWQMLVESIEVTLARTLTSVLTSWSVGVFLFLGFVWYERRALKARQTLESADRLASLGTLTAGVAHEINNPLAVVSLSLGVLEDQAATEEDRAAAVAEIRDALGRVERIVTDMRVYSRLDQQDTGHATRVHPAVLQALRITRARVGDGVPIEVDIREDPWVSMAEGRLVQVLVNVLVNAVQAVAASEAPQVALLVRLQGAFVRLRVQDNGEGWPTEHAHLLLEPFYTTRQAGEGTGLGLHIVNTLVTGARGRLLLDDAYPNGARVDVLLPQRPPPPAIQPTESIPPSERKLLVLVIDDDRMVGRAVGRALRMHEVELCSSGEQALVRLEQDPQPDAVLLDLTMPGISGADVYESISTRWPRLQTRTAFLTAGAVSEPMRHFLKHVDRPVLYKPARADALGELVRELGREARLASRSAS